MKIHDSKLKKKIEFKPLEEGKLSMYVCGPTVYDRAHLGHGRSAVSFDIIRKYFIYKGFDVKYVSNYTDIDDKMINRAAEEKITVAELADKIIPMYEEDYGKLGIMPPDVQPRATEYAEANIGIIEKLEKNGYTYVLDDGVYFDVAKFPAYGEFSGQSLEDLKMGARVCVVEAKRNPYDFVLWKFKKEGEPSWPSPWGEGRPGWHIECSSMIWKELGEKLDIHGGGLDLKFPHHECEVAQSVGAFGEGAFAQHWMHNGFINVDNEKMSKSLGNFFTLKDVFEKYDPQVVRLMFLQTHYRNPINFSDVLLEQAKSALERLHGFVRRLESINGDAGNEYGLKEMFEESMDNDLDSSGALGAVFDLAKAVNTDLDNGKNVNGKAILEELRAVDQVLGVVFPEEAGDLDAEVEALIAEREEARKNKDFEKADKIRGELNEKGIVLEDSKGGVIWKKR